MQRALLLAALVCAAPAAAQQSRTDDLAVKRLLADGDVAGVDVYAAANKALIASGDHRSRIVMLGDSITFHWPADALPALADALIVNRGIPGQTSSQMLLRFEDDVAALEPAAVVLLAGTNDVRVFNGPPAAARADRLRRIARNITAMADIADAHRIGVILCAVPPVGPNQAGVERDPVTILAVNDWLRDFARARGYRFLDYHAALVGADGLVRPDYTSDGLHLTSAGYHAIDGLLATALQTVERR